MATFKAEVQNKRADGTYNVRIRLTHNGGVRRISTNIYVTKTDITGGLKIKNARVLNKCDELISKCRDICNCLGFAIQRMDVGELKNRIKDELAGVDNFKLDIIAYAKTLTLTMSESTAGVYGAMLNALRRYAGCGVIDISEINRAFLKGFKDFIAAEPSQQGNNRKSEREGATLRKGRAVTAYLSCLRSVYKRAQDEYNEEDRGVIRIPYYPFKNFDFGKDCTTRKRALTVKQIQAIIDLPDADTSRGSKNNRFNLAKDCFILSFALMGMNSTDLYSCNSFEGGVLIYLRRKTEKTKSDKTPMQVKINSCIFHLINKYRDTDNKRAFNFYRSYSNARNFNRALNTGLKQVGEAVGVVGLEFYAARHSWATIARSSAAGVDKYTVHEALNHSDGKMKVTDIYIDKDYSVIHAANKKVLDLFKFKQYAEH